MPSPNKGESQKAYISRCIPFVLDEGTAKDQKHAAAICHGMWRQYEKRKKMAGRASEILEDIIENLKDASDASKTNNTR